MRKINEQIEKGLDTPIEIDCLDIVLDDEAMQKHIKDKGVKAE